MSEKVSYVCQLVGFLQLKCLLSLTRNFHPIFIRMSANDNKISVAIYLYLNQFDMLELAYLYADLIANVLISQ